MKLFTKLILLTTITSIGIIIAIGIVSYNFTRIILERSVEEQQREIIRQGMEKIDRLLFERFNDIQTVAGNYILQQSLIPEKSRSIPLSNIVVHRVVDDLALQTGPWDELHVIDLNGVIRYSSDPEDDGDLVQEEEIDFAAFQKSKNGEVNYSDVFKDIESDTLTIVFSAPIRDNLSPERKIVGVVTGHLSWPIITEALENLQNLENSTIEIFNSQGIEIANSDRHEGHIFKNDASRLPSITEALKGNEVSRIGKSVNGEDGYLVSAVPERGYLGYSGNGWVIRIETPAQIAYAQATKSALQVSLIVSPFIIVGVILLLYFILRILRPIKHLTKTVEQLTAGNLEITASESSNDEIGQLSKAFNLMAQKLKSSYQGMEEKVNEKTVELDKKIQELERANALMIGREVKMAELKDEVARLEEELKQLKGSV